MSTPRRGLRFHFTHIDNLASGAPNGLRRDNDVLTSKRPFVFTDCNAAQVYAEFPNNLTLLDDFVDWPLMEARYFAEASAILEGLGLPKNVRTRTNWYF